MRKRTCSSETLTSDRAHLVGTHTSLALPKMGKAMRLAAHAFVSMGIEADLIKENAYVEPAGAISTCALHQRKCPPK